MAKDPVCGMTVDEKKPAATYVYQGATYYFCHPSCKAKFEKNPDPYLAKK
ncbi:MAG: YHS domain-containing protein [Nitrospirae bacterium]|nr:YHS domain-containing protein [Nitrospirota bacterium]